MSFTLDGSIAFPTANNAITVRNEYVLWQPAQQTGSDVQLAGVNGALARPRVLAATVHTLELVISGRVRVTGTATTAAANLLNFRFGKVIENAKWALATVDISIPGGELS